MRLRPSGVYCNGCLRQPMRTFFYCDYHESQQRGKTPRLKISSNFVFFHFLTKFFSNKQVINVQSSVSSRQLKHLRHSARRSSGNDHVPSPVLALNQWEASAIGHKSSWPISYWTKINNIIKEIYILENGDTWWNAGNFFHFFSMEHQHPPRVWGYQT